MSATKNILVILTIALITNPLLSQNQEIRWWYDLNDSSFGNAAAGDIDDDGILEIVFGCYRNDSTVYALNAESGTLLWKRNLSSGPNEGCNDVAPLIYDVNMDGTLEVIVPSSCNPVTFCFEGASGNSIWETTLHGSDSPPSISDVDGDGRPEILHGNFGGFVTCLNAEDGSIVYDFPVNPNSWIQTAPTILDADMDGVLDYFVAEWSFSGPDKMYCYRASDSQLLWETDIASDNFYHGASVADIDQDGYKELVIGNYDGNVYALNAEDGSLAWSYAFPTSFFTPSATSIADLNGDGNFEITFFDYYRLGVLSHEGELLWEFEMDDFGQSFRGAAISDVTGDGNLDIVFGSSKGILYAVNGKDGTLAFKVDLADHVGDPNFALDHGPLIADFDKDGLMDIFIVGGHTEFPDFENNYGRAYLISTGSPGGPDWLMFRKDSVRSGHVPISINTGINTIANQHDIISDPYPNPCRDHVYIDIGLNKPKRIQVTLHSLDSKLIKEIYNDIVDPSKANIRIDLPTELSEGIYQLSIIVDDDFLVVKKLHLIK